MTKDEQIKELERQLDHYKKLYEDKIMELVNYQISHGDWKRIAEQLAGYLSKLNG